MLLSETIEFDLENIEDRLSILKAFKDISENNKLKYQIKNLKKYLILAKQLESEKIELQKALIGCKKYIDEEVYDEISPRQAMLNDYIQYIVEKQTDKKWEEILNETV
jgi:hypothetical protein